MRYTSFYTIKELNYKALEAKWADLNIPVDLRKQMQTMLEDHRAMVELRKRILNDQNAHAWALFQLFEEPSLPLPEANLNETSVSEGLVSNVEQNNASDESLENHIAPTPKPKKKRPGTGKKALPLGKIVQHALSSEEKICTCCKKNMHVQREKTRTYVMALPLLSTQTHIRESRRCLVCDTQVTAKGDDNLKNECIGRYHFSAVSSLAALRYQYGMASYRMESMSDAIGIKISDSTQFTLFENAASLLKPFVSFLEKEVANAPVQHTDDTHNIILEVVKDIEAEQNFALNEGKDIKAIRSGIHTTNLTGVFPQGKLILYKTGLHHSGEILAKILAKRTVEEQIIIMADASSSNTCKLDLNVNKDIKMANCNSHAVRKFKELAQQEEKIAQEFKIKDFKTSEPLRYFLTRYKIIFENEQKTKDMSPSQRLLFHRKNSLPLMREMKRRVDTAFVNKEFEPNNPTAGVYKYFYNHYEKLCAFCHFESAPVCNNLSERMLKTIIRHRKNSLFFKTQLGATVADILTTILFTAKANDLNSVEYLKNLLLYQAQWKENPENWLPWNYAATIDALQNTDK